MEEYKGIGQDTIPMRRVSQQANDRRHLSGHPGNQGGYRGSHASYDEYEEEHDQEEEYYEEELLFEDLNTSYSSQGSLPLCQLQVY